MSHVEHPMSHQDHPQEASRSCLSTENATRLLDHARRFQRAALEGNTPRPLQGKHLGLLGASGTDEAQALFRSAAEELGGHVAVMRADLSAASSPREVRDTARLLGRLYDAVECQGLDPALVRRIGVQAQIPVFEGAATHLHPTARLAGSLGERTTPTDNRRFVLQALLVDSVA